MASLIDELKFGHAFLGFVKTPGPEAAFRMSDVALRMGDMAPAEKIAARAMEHDNLRELFDRCYFPEKPNLDELMKLPEGTLGHEFAKLMKAAGYKADFYPPRDPKTPIGYLAIRELQTHDIFHVLTGIGTDFTGEIGLQAFMLGQHGSGLSAAIIAAGILHQLKKNPLEVTPLMDAILEGYSRGKAAQFLLGFPWEEKWDQSLDQLRIEAGLAA